MPSKTTAWTLRVKRDKQVIFLPLDTVATVSSVKNSLWEVLKSLDVANAPESLQDIELGSLDESGALPATQLADTDIIDGTRHLVWKLKSEPEFALVPYPDSDEE
ncbi:hypothetical protein PYCC9005_002500 [Savitreella phatthalungensis]